MMQVYCTRPSCPNPENKLQVSSQQPPKFCINCGMNLILNNRFIATDMLATGGFGKLFIGIDTKRNNHQCVIKQLQFDPLLSDYEKEKIKELFKREAEALKQLGHHRQIPELFDDFDFKNGNDEFSYIAEEYVDGDTLEEELDKEGNFTEEKIIDLLKQVLPILQLIHDQGHIHRDIKPSNLKKNSQGFIYLLDFGAVKLENKSLQNQPNPKLNTRIYTTGYAPPEQQTGDNIYSCTDLYALAVTCIQLLTAKSPDQLYDSYNATWNWTNETKVNYLLETVLNRMLESKPEKRFQSASEILQALTLLINQYNSSQINTNTNTNTIVSPPPVNPVNPTNTINPVTPVEKFKKSLFQSSFLGATGALIGSILLKILTIKLLPIIIFIWLVIYIPIIWFKHRYDSILNKVSFLILGTTSTVLSFYVLKDYFLLGQIESFITFSWLSIVAILISSLLSIIGLFIYQLFDSDE